MLFRRRREEDDPLAALRGDGSTPFGDAPTAVPAATPSASPHAAAPGRAGQASGRIVARRDTGVLVAGRPRVRLTVEVTPAGGPPFTIEAHVVVAEGSAAAVGDTVDVDYEGDGRAIAVRLRPAIRPAARGR